MPRVTPVPRAVAPLLLALFTSAGCRGRAESLPPVPTPAALQAKGGGTWPAGVVGALGPLRFAMPLAKVPERGPTDRLAGEGPGGVVRVQNAGPDTVDVRWDPCGVNVLLYRDAARSGAPAFDQRAERQRRLLARGILSGCTMEAPGARLAPGDTFAPRKFRFRLTTPASLDSAGLAPGVYYAVVRIDGIAWRRARGPEGGQPGPGPLAPLALWGGEVRHRTSESASDP